MAFSTATQNKISKAIGACEDFHHRTMSGLSTYGQPIGMLPPLTAEVYRNDMEGARRRGKKAYVVISYSTPIGWWIEGSGWNVPEFQYGQQTSMHQGLLKRSIEEARKAFVEVSLP